jgi:dCTP deaminase
MILTGSAIHEAVKLGDISISPFNPDQLSPNSYDFRLGGRCKVYQSEELDCAAENPTMDVRFGSDGLLLEPCRVYLFNTHEEIGSERYVPIIRGRSSVGRLGLFVDITADLIDLGSVGQLTLQLHAVVPVRVYPLMLIGQVTFWQVEGSIQAYAGKYKGLQSPVASLSYLDAWKTGESYESDLDGCALQPANRL